jgi:hypothetical protein
VHEQVPAARAAVSDPVVELLDRRKRQPEGDWPSLGGLTPDRD